MVRRHSSVTPDKPKSTCSTAVDLQRCSGTQVGTGAVQIGPNLVSPLRLYCEFEGGTRCRPMHIAVNYSARQRISDLEQQP
jgi:hypothetical protein